MVLDLVRFKLSLVILKMQYKIYDNNLWEILSQNLKMFLFFRQMP
jgi:hypothetical protein